MVSADDTEPQVNPQSPEGAAEEGTAAPPVETPDAPASPDDAAPVTPASTAAPEAADAAGNPTAETPSDQAATEAPAAPENTPAASTDADAGAPTPAASGADEAPAAAEAPASGGTEASSDAASAEAGSGEAPTDGAPAAEGSASGEKPEAKDGEGSKDGEGASKRKRRPRGRRQGRGGQRGGGGRRRFQWDEVFLRQRLEILRAMDPDPKAIEWAVNAGGRFDVADILAGEGSSGREFGRRAYAATPETDDQAAWIILSAVRARDIVPIARQAVSGTTDQREQVKDAIEKVGIARVNPALQGERPPQQVFAERAKRVDLTSEGGEEQKCAWALLSLARPQDVKYAASPRKPRPGGPGGRPGGNRFGDDDRRGRRREPGIPGGKFSVGESGIGGELGAKLRAALEAAENNEVADTRDQK